MDSLRKLEQEIWNKMVTMGIPRVRLPDDIDQIINLSAEELASIDDMDVANAIQYKLGQFMLYIEQNVRVIKAMLNRLEECYNRELLESINSDSSMPKNLSLTEKKARVHQQSNRLQQLSAQIDELKILRDVLDGSTEGVEHLLDVIKQIYYRLRMQAYGS